MILLTGFEAFGGHGANPTAWLMERLGGEPGLAAAVLPVTWEGAVAAFAALVERHRPRAAVAFGLAAGAEHIRIERVALNLDEAELPDNAGEIRRGRRIVPEGPAGLWSGLPVEVLVAALAAGGVPAAASTHAGTYVCNHLFYSVRHRWPDLPMGFVHVPPLADPALPGRGLAASALEHAARRVVAVVRDRLPG